MRIEFSDRTRVDAGILVGSPDDLGVVRCTALAYGFTPKAVTTTRRFVRELGAAEGVRYVAFDVGDSFLPPHCPSVDALVEEVRRLVVEEDVITVAMPHGSISGVRLEFCLACSMTTMDLGSAIVSDVDGRDGQALSWAVGRDVASVASEPGRLTADEALRLRIAEVLVPAGMRFDAVRAIAERQGRRHLSSRALYKSLVIAGRGHREHASA